VIEETEAEAAGINRPPSRSRAERLGWLKTENGVHSLDVAQFHHDM